VLIEWSAVLLGQDDVGDSMTVANLVNGRLVAALAAFTLATIPCDVLGQISVDSGDGNTVNIGPGGINVRSTGGERATVQSRTPGQVTTGAHRTTVRKVSTVSSGKGKTATAGSPAGAAINLKAALAKLEMSAYGRVDEASPPVVRIEKLEIDNLGKKGTGSNIVRVQELAKSLGVDLSSTTTATTTVTTTTPPETIVDNAGPGLNVQVNPGGIGVQVAPAALMVTDNHQEDTYNCNNSAVAVASNHCNLMLRGTCKQLNVKGNHNLEHVERTTNIQALGNHNIIVWVKTPQPTIGNWQLGQL
jgi:hypothetical protein